MSCPGVGLHAHPTAPMVDPTVRPAPVARRRVGLGAAIAWSCSFAGHAGVVAWLALADAPHVADDPSGSLTVELIVADVDVPAASKSSANSETPVSAPPTPPRQDVAGPVAPAEATTKPAAADAKVIETIAPISELALVEPPRRPQPPEVSPAKAAAPPAPATSTSADAPESAPGAVGDTAALPADGEGETTAAPRGDNRKPIYPAYARRRGLEGRVVLQVDVTPDGAAGAVAVAESSRHDFFDEAALDAVRTWRFQPARRAGVAVSSRLRVPITFRLTDL